MPQRVEEIPGQGGSYEPALPDGLPVPGSGSGKPPFEGYTQSVWGSLVDTSLRLAELEGDNELAEWANWMKREGFCLSEKEIMEKMEEIWGENK